MTDDERMEADNPALHDFLETWGMHCGASRPVFRGHLCAMLRKLRQPDVERQEWTEGEPPKDGRAYMGFFPGRAGYVADQRYILVNWSEWGGGVWDNGAGHHMSDRPTHWQRLPNPPANSERGDI